MRGMSSFRQSGETPHCYPLSISQHRAGLSHSSLEARPLRPGSCMSYWRETSRFNLALHEVSVAAAKQSLGGLLDAEWSHLFRKGAEGVQLGLRAGVSCAR